MKRIVFDCDGILCNFNTAAHKVLSLYCEMQPLPEHGPTTWDWYPVHGATAEAEAKLAVEMQRGQFWRSLKPHADVSAYLAAQLVVLNNEHEVTFVTARPGPRRATEVWLREHIGISAARVLHTPGPKVQALIAMQPHVVIEDSGITLEAFVNAAQTYPSKQAAPLCLNILVKRPYNMSYWNTPGLTLANTTGEALALALEATR